MFSFLFIYFFLIFFNFFKKGIIYLFPAKEKTKEKVIKSVRQGVDGFYTREGFNRRRIAKQEGLLFLVSKDMVFNVQKR